MNRAQKQQWIDNTHAAAKDAAIVIVAQYKGLTVAEMTQLRVNVRKAGATFNVPKNTLASRAFANTPYDKVVPLFKGPTAIAYSNEPVAIAKVLSEFSKKQEKLVLMGGAFGNTVLNKAQIQELANLPSLDELRAKILALLNTPATRIAGVLQAPAGQLARVCGAYAKKGA